MTTKKEARQRAEGWADALADRRVVKYDNGLRFTAFASPQKALSEAMKWREQGGVAEVVIVEVET